MRYLMLIVMLCVSAAGAAAQEETLYKGDIVTSGFGGPVVKYTAIRDQGAVMIGGRGGWIINHSLVHATLYTLIGGGSTRYVKDVGPVSESNDQVGESDAVFVLEPAAGAELNVTKWFRLDAGVSYRMVRGVGQAGLKNRDLSGVAGTLALKFGRF